MLTRIATCAVLAALLTLAGIAATASAVNPCSPFYRNTPAFRAMQYNWHGAYAHTNYGRPVALVVPPTAALQTDWSWGTGSSRISRVDHQFGRNFRGFGGSQAWRYTPSWPADTRHFGVYYVRAPW